MCKYNSDTFFVRWWYIQNTSHYEKDEGKKHDSFFSSKMLNDERKKAHVGTQWMVFKCKNSNLLISFQDFGCFAKIIEPNPNVLPQSIQIY